MIFIVFCFDLKVLRTTQLQEIIFLIEHFGDVFFDTKICLHYIINMRDLNQ
jgi:hypothetical protein